MLTTPLQGASPAADHHLASARGEWPAAPVLQEEEEGSLPPTFPMVLEGEQPLRPPFPELIPHSTCISAAAGRRMRARTQALDYYGVARGLVPALLLFFPGWRNG